MVLTKRASEPKKLQVLLGTFIHSSSRSELEYIHKAAVAVDAEGKIVAVVKGSGDANAAKEKALSQLGWKEEDVDVVEAKEGQFFFPGFIGAYTCHD